MKYLFTALGYHTRSLSNISSFCCFYHPVDNGKKTPWLTVLPNNTMRMNKFKLIHTQRKGRYSESTDLKCILPSNTSSTCNCISLINVFLLKKKKQKTYAVSPRQKDLIMTTATLFWRKWCFVSIQHHMKIYLLLQKKKTATEFLTWTFFLKLYRGCWKQAKWPLDDHCFTILCYFLLLFHLEKFI